MSTVVRPHVSRRIASANELAGRLKTLVTLPRCFDIFQAEIVRSELVSHSAQSFPVANRLNPLHYAFYAISLIALLNDPSEKLVIPLEHRSWKLIRSNFREMRIRRGENSFASDDDKSADTRGPFVSILARYYERDQHYLPFRRKRQYLSTCGRRVCYRSTVRWWMAEYNSDYTTTATIVTAIDTELAPYCSAKIRII